MKYYCDCIPLPLAEKLEEKGMPYIDIDCDTFNEGTEYQRDEVWCNNTYAEVFDWLMSEKNLAVIIYRMTQNFRIAIRSASSGILRADIWGLANNNKDADWHEAANAAIEKALTLI